MYYITPENKVYAQSSSNFCEVKITKNEDGIINIESLKTVKSIEVKDVCTLEEVIARYSCEEEIEETKEVVKEPKKAKK